MHAYPPLPRWLAMTLAAGLLGAAIAVQAQSQPPTSTSAASPSTQPTAQSAPATQPSSGQVLNQLLRQRPKSPVIQPKTQPPIEYLPNQVGQPGQDKINPAILGVAPGQPQPKLLPEGTFIINRRGRLIRSTDGAHEMYQFIADSAQAPQPPMILEPCRLLESMEDLVQRRGDSVVFIVSGQVHTYRGANYLMPTMMKVAPPTTNLGH